MNTIVLPVVHLIGCIHINASVNVVSDCLDVAQSRDFAQGLFPFICNHVGFVLKRLGGLEVENKKI